MGKQMYKYSIYDLTVSSDIELPELQAVRSEKTADVDIRRARLDIVPGADVDPNVQRVEASPDCARITYESLGTFLIESGKRIRYDPATPGKQNEKIFRRLLKNQAMTVLLLQRGLLVLHASAVSIDDQAVVFLGAQTAGKSTMTAAFHREGSPMIADDVVAIRFDDEGPMVVPSVPQIRLSKETVKGLAVKNTIQYEHDWGPEKVYLPIDDQSPTVPLGCIYTLEEDDTICINSLDGSAAFIELVTNTYAQGLLSDTEATTLHFEQCSNVLNRVSMREINRPKSFERLPKVLEMVARDSQRFSKTTNTTPNSGG